MESVKLRLLVTVKTYPTPSKRYREIVCTAGVKEDGSWVRLYPINYRYRDYSQWYKKYQWIEVDVTKHKKDPRPESFKPESDIKIIGEPLSTKNAWADRKKYVLAQGIKTMCWLLKQSQKAISLAVIKPSKVDDFYWEEVNKEWSEKQLQALNQLSLFEENKPLEKIPYQFKYRFYCEEDDCRGHNMMIEDWEVMELYRRMCDRYGKSEALKKVKEKFHSQICASDRDTYFFVGTVLQYGTWIIVGTFWPPKVNQA
ncbi:MAG: hypothetical protein H5T85_09070 [Actinobacteria bacterium]|nr:hypothetical protein [Actinomycetota bacterium]